MSRLPDWTWGTEEMGKGLPRLCPELGGAVDATGRDAESPGCTCFMSGGPAELSLVNQEDMLRRHAEL